MKLFFFRLNSNSNNLLLNAIPKAFVPHIWRDLKILKLLLTSKTGPKDSDGISETCVLKKYILPLSYRFSMKFYLNLN